MAKTIKAEPEMAMPEDATFHSGFTTNGHGNIYSITQSQ
jgi:hypothetical protein